MRFKVLRRLDLAFFVAVSRCHSNLFVLKERTKRIFPSIGAIKFDFFAFQKVLGYLFFLKLMPIFDI
jgi:hypothetical protein